MLLKPSDVKNFALKTNPEARSVRFSLFNLGY